MGLAACEQEIYEVFALKFLPITLVEVERSFSKNKSILSPNLQHFFEQSLSKCMIVHFF